MTYNQRLLFGPASAVLFAFGIALLPLMDPNYDSVRQTVSEIGEVSAPARIPFAILLIAVAACVLVFATGLWEASRRLGRSTWAAWLAAASAISPTGIAIFAYPHPLHNVFGLSELVGYQAPWVLALTWRRASGAGAVVAFSWIMAAVVWIAIIVNLATLDRSSGLWLAERPIYGLVQRGLFASYFIWLAGVGLMVGRVGA